VLSAIVSVAARGAGGAVERPDAGIDDFNRRNHARRRGEHRCERAAGTFQRTVQHERQPELDAWHDEAFRGNRRPGREQHVVEQVP
jgi:hypothetical protein